MSARMLRGKVGTAAALVALGTLLWAATPRFLTWENISNVLLQSSINAILAVGLTFVIITAGIDLSVGSLLALCGVLLGGMLRAGLPPQICVLLCLAAGGACGLSNGLLVSLGRLPPFIATLGMMSVARGLALIYAEGRPISGFGRGFTSLSSASLFMVPLPVVVMLTVVGTAQFVLSRTVFGRYVYAIGGNEEAAWLSGIRVKLHKTLVYVISGCLAALGGILLTARLNSAQPQAGMMYELDAIAAAVIGGTSLMGGEGSAVGTLLGALIMGVLRNGLNLLDVSSYVQQLAIGCVIIAAVLIDRLRR